MAESEHPVNASSEIPAPPRHRRPVRRLTYGQAVQALAEAEQAVEYLEEDLRVARRTLQQAHHEMYHALHERLTVPLP